MKLFIYYVIAQLLEILSIFTPLKTHRIIFSSINNENFDSNARYLFIYFLKNNPQMNILFVVNNDELRNKLIQQYGNHFISSKKIKDLFIIAKAKIWITSALETPYIPLFFLKNRKRFIYHIGHGVPLKKIILNEEKITILKKVNRYLRSRLFTHVLSFSAQFTEIMKRSFQNKNIKYLPLGQPRNDALNYITKEEQFNQIKSIYPNIPNHQRAILYAPTWRPYDKVKFFPFKNLTAEELNQKLIEYNTILFLRKHPFFPSLLDESYINQSNIYPFNSDLFPEIMDYLSYFDKLITDYSSIYLDFLCLNRPIAFIPYDLDKYIEHTGFTMPYKTLTPGRYLNTKEDFFKFIIAMDDDLQDERARVAKLVNAKKGGNCEENYQFILQLLNGK